MENTAATVWVEWTTILDQEVSRFGPGIGIQQAPDFRYGKVVFILVPQDVWFCEI